MNHNLKNVAIVGLLLASGLAMVVPPAAASITDDCPANLLNVNHTPTPGAVPLADTVSSASQQHAFVVTITTAQAGFYKANPVSGSTVGSVMAYPAEVKPDGSIKCDLSAGLDLKSSSQELTTRSGTEAKWVIVGAFDTTQTDPAAYDVAPVV